MKYKKYNDDFHEKSTKCFIISIQKRIFV